MPSVAPDVTVISVPGIVPSAVEQLDLPGERLAKPEDARHRRVLVVAVAHRAGDRLDELGRAVEVGKALPDIDRVELERELRHHLEDADAGGRELRLDRLRDGHDEPIIAGSGQPAAGSLPAKAGSHS